MYGLRASHAPIGMCVEDDWQGDSFGDDLVDEIDHDDMLEGDNDEDGVCVCSVLCVYTSEVRTTAPASSQSSSGSVAPTQLVPE